MLSTYQNYLALTAQDIEFDLIVELDACFELWHLHQLFFLATTKLGLSQSRSLPLSYEPGEANNQKAIEWEKKTHLPLLNLHRQIILVNTGSGQVNLKQALNNLIEVKTQISLSQKSNFFRDLLNVGIRAVNKHADQASSKNLLALILVGMEEKLIQDPQGNIPNMLFRAMIESCLRAEGFKSANHYLQTFLPLIPKENQQESAGFLKGRLLLHQKQYADLEEHLRHIHFSLMGDQVRKRLFLLEAAYELRPESIDDNILPEAKALKRYLQRHEEHLSQTLRSRHLTLIGWAIRFWEKYFEVEQLKALEQEVAQDVNHPFSAWLHQHIKKRMLSLA